MSSGNNLEKTFESMTTVYNIQLKIECVDMLSEVKVSGKYKWGMGKWGQLT